MIEKSAAVFKIIQPIKNSENECTEKMLERKIAGYFRDAKKGFEIQAETIYEFAEYVLGCIFWVSPDRIGY